MTDTTTEYSGPRPAVGAPVERPVRRGEKTIALIALLKNGPMRAKDAQALIGHGSFERLVRIGVLRHYQDENPDYAGGVPYSRPMCSWVELENEQYVPRLESPIKRAVLLLEAAGYVVQAPNAELTGPRVGHRSDE